MTLEVYPTTFCQFPLLDRISGKFVQQLSVDISGAILLSLLVKNQLKNCLKSTFTLLSKSILIFVFIRLNAAFELRPPSNKRRILEQKC